MRSRVYVVFLLVLLLAVIAIGRNSDYWVSFQVYIDGSALCNVTIQEGKNSEFESKIPPQKYMFTPSVVNKNKGKVSIKISSVNVGKDGKETLTVIETVEANTKTTVSAKKTPLKFGFLITKIGDSPGVCTAPK